MRKRIGKKADSGIALDFFGWGLLGAVTILIGILIYLIISGKINLLLSIF